MKSNNLKRIYIVLHIAVWLVLFTFPYLLSIDNRSMLPKVIEHNWIPLMFYAFIFYINYFYIIEKFLFKKKNILFFIANIVLIAVISVLYFFIKSSFFHNDFIKPPKPEHPPTNLFIYIDTISFIVPLGFSVALKVSERWVKVENQRKEMENIKLESELQSLKYQLQPHFFFNALNNIYSLVDISPEKAQETIHRLGKLMRHLLYESNNETVLLEKEIEFLTMYIELMKLRFSSKVKVEYSFPDLKKPVKIYPFMFISFVENAFKHGVSATKDSEIKFEMQADDEKIFFYSLNTYFPKSEKDKSGSGIGLVNLKKRLELLYKQKYELNTIIVDGYYIAELSLFRT